MSLTVLKEEILTAIFNKDGSKLLACEMDSRSVGVELFRSNIVFLTAIVQNKNGKIKVPLVVKYEPFHVELRKYLTTTSEQFHNEVFMYSEVLPFLEKNNIVGITFPKFYYGVGIINDPDRNVLVLQDLRSSDYRLTKEKVFLDYQHLAIAMEKLGKFHALSYAAKEKDRTEFNRLTNNLKETSWVEETFYTPLVSVCFHRAIDPLIRDNKHVEVLQRLLKLVDDGTVKFMSALVTPEEPLAVICHGDFCRNNILFRYEDDKPIDVKFFDIATARYSSPVVDIAFFLFLNSSREIRQTHLDDLLRIYHNSLYTALPGTEVPSLEDIQKDFLQKAIYGFVHCSFFLLTMLYGNIFESVDSMLTFSYKEFALEHLKCGGEEGTKLLSDMVEEMVDRRYLTLQHKFLQSV